jgi:hypothetical protein
MLNRFVVQIALDGTGIDAIICQFEAAAMPQHVRVNLHIEPGSLGCASHHGLKRPLIAILWLDYPLHRLRQVPNH